MSARARAAAFIPLAVLGLSACAGSVAPDELEQQITTQLTEQVGQAPDDVSCPEPLEAEVGATQRCELTAGGTTLGVTVTVTVTAVEGSDVSFDIQVDEAPQ